MDSNKINALLTTIRTGSFNKAAEELNCTQPAVTQMMNSLENELGCRVLQRNHNGIKLTPAGEELLPFFSAADTAMLQLAQKADQISKGLSVPLRIGSFSSISNTWLPGALRAYHDAHPEVTFDIRIGTDTLSDWLLYGKIDIALGDAERCRAFRWYPLIDDPYYAVLPTKLAPADRREITQAELAGSPFLMAPLNALESILSVSPKDQLRVNCDDDSTLLSMVAQGLGVTVMPRLSLQSTPRNVKVLELHPAAKRVLGIALPNSPSRAALEFSGFLRKNIKQIAQIDAMCPPV